VKAYYVTMARITSITSFTVEIVHFFISLLAFYVFPLHVYQADMLEPVVAFSVFMINVDF